MGVINVTGQIFALDFAFVKTQNVFRSHGCFLTYAMYYHRDTAKSINKLCCKKRTLNQQSVRVKEKHQLSQYRLY